MDSYDFSRRTGRPVSPPLPEDYSMDYLPQMATYSSSTQSQHTSVSQPIDFDGSTSMYTGATQSRHTSAPQIEYGSASQGTSMQSHLTRGRHTPEYRSAMALSWRSSNESQAAFARRIGIPQTTLSDWIKEAGSSSQSRPRAMPSRSHYTAEYKSAALSEWRARRETETYVDIATRMGIPAGTFHKWIVKSEGSSRGAR